MKRPVVLLLTCAIPAATSYAQSATVPTDIQQPGTQPREVSELESPNKCDNCHGGYDPSVELSFNWRGSMMAQATRDPLFWACLAVAEQDFVGSGDLCIRCHSLEGWVGGRSTPTDGSGLAQSDANGVMCDACHQMVDPDGSEHLGVQNPPFVANDGGDPPNAYRGSGMYVLYAGNEKLGPYADSVARHPDLQSELHRSADLCATCHDVSNPAVGDLAHNNGAQVPLTSGYSGIPGAPVEGKAAFNHFPYEYGVVERTTSEHAASLLSGTLVSAHPTALDYTDLPANLQAGALKRAYEAALVAGTGGNYELNEPRYFTCQTCHMPPVTGVGCNKQNAPTRKDLPLHDLTGGNYWTPEAIKYLDAQSALVLGGGLTSDMVASIDAGAQRALTNLQNAASLEVNGNTLRVVNLTGHKLPSGFPEGRRMWLNVKWFDYRGELVREDGAYGPLAVVIDGEPTQVNTILDLEDPDTRIYEAHFGMTKEWADQLIALGYPRSFPLSYDRVSGAVDFDLGDLADLSAGSSHETFHFVLNNILAGDNRIPPYGMSYDMAVTRNILPVPASQYGNPSTGGAFLYYDELALAPPTGALRARIELLYQPTSWEYIQFLYLNNDGSVGFLGSTGEDLLEAWLNTGMAEPAVLATATWRRPGYRGKLRIVEEAAAPGDLDT